ncbi:MAG: diacylglycerol kinase [Actinomycetaceae bacterium]|nr:diacylglycerol kinase [Actinomycetaceae bacterium]
MTWELGIAILALLIAIAALLGGLSNRRAIQEIRRENRKNRFSISSRLPSGALNEQTGPPYVIYNPTKVADWDYLRKLMARAAADASLPEPVWVRTTPEDTGAGQTARAIAAGASVVIAAGGDGTVRAVAEGLIDSDIPLGLLPVGTGNILARNLDLPLGNPREMAIIALTGHNRVIDVGRIRITQPEEAHTSVRPDLAALEADLAKPERTRTRAQMEVAAQEAAAKDNVPYARDGEHIFVANAGIGFDAALIEEADGQDLKSKVGWLAYVKAAIPHLFADKMNAVITTPKLQEGITTEARSVMFLNCGELIAGVTIDPGTKFDDGWLELAVLDTRGGIIGWADLVRRLGLQGMGIKRVDIPGVSSVGDFNVHRISECTVITDAVHPVQADGDMLGYAREISAQIIPNALHVRVRN